MVDTDFILEMIQAMTGEDAWDVNEASMNIQRGLLVVRQTKEMHEKIERVVLMLRGVR